MPPGVVSQAFWVPTGFLCLLVVRVTAGPDGGGGIDEPPAGLPWPEERRRDPAGEGVMDDMPRSKVFVVVPFCV